MSGQETLDGRYRLLRVIGHGGMGVVHEAEDVQLGRRVAVKILGTAQGFPDGQEVLKRFRREAQALARISHPNVVTVHDTGVHDDRPYLVMELLDGLGLHRLVASCGPLEPDVVRVVATAMCSGLGAAHAAGVLHRDVKPSNVRVTVTGQVVLQDFGLAWLTETSAITRVGTLIGTPQYMAPESIRGEQSGAASDLYGLGLCMYLMLTGESPFDVAMDVGAVVEQVVDEGVPSLASRPGIPEDLVTIVDGLCERDPSRRLADPSAVQQALAPPPEAPEHLTALVEAKVREQALSYVHETLEADSSLPEYFDTVAQATAALPVFGDGGGPLSLSDATRQLVIGSMTAQNPVSRLREAVSLVQRGEFQEAVRMLTAVAQVCSTEFGESHSMTLASRYWQAVCLARLGAGREALALFAKVGAHLKAGEGETGG